MSKEECVKACDHLVGKHRHLLWLWNFDGIGVGTKMALQEYIDALKATAAQRGVAAAQRAAAAQNVAEDWQPFSDSDNSDSAKWRKLSNEMTNM